MSSNIEALESYLSSQVVTARWLANTLAVSSAEAENLMGKLKSDKPSEFEASYLVTGQKNGGATAYLPAIRTPAS